MAIHGVSSATTVKTPTPAAARLLSEKKAQTQQIIDKGAEASRQRGNVVSFQERTGVQNPNKKKKNTEELLSAHEALLRREETLNHRHHMYDNSGTAIAIDMSAQRRQSLSTHSPHYNYHAAVQQYTNTATIGYQQARKVATTISLIV